MLVGQSRLISGADYQIRCSTAKCTRITYQRLILSMSKQFQMKNGEAQGSSKETKKAKDWLQNHATQILEKYQKQYQRTFVNL